MCLNFEDLKTWVLSSISLALLAGLISGCSPKSISIVPLSSSVTVVKSVTGTKSTGLESAELISSSGGIYRSERFNFQFTYYLFDVVLENLTTIGSDELLETIEIWSHDHAQKIRAGAYREGTEYPANVNITVHKNSQKLSLNQWVFSNNWFVAPREFKPITVAEQPAITFGSSGLYEYQNVAVKSPDQTKIILISWAYTGSFYEDTIYKNAFEQIINSLTFR